MRKYKLFTALSVIGAGLALASCKTTTTPSNSQAGTSQAGSSQTGTLTPTTPSTPTTPVTPTTTAGGSTTNIENVKTDESFVVNVKYPDGTPVRNAKVQWCSVANGTCYTMVDVDDNGQAFTNMLKDIAGSFTVHVQNLPKGYGYNPYVLVQTHEDHVGDVTIIKLQDDSRIDSLDDDDKPVGPVEIKNGLGYYNAKVTLKSTLYIYLSFNEAGTYVFESYSPSPSDLIIGYYGNDINNPGEPNVYNDNSGNENNFKLEFKISEEDAKLNKQYLFGFTEKSSTSTFTFSILKK